LPDLNRFLDDVRRQQSPFHGFIYRFYKKIRSFNPPFVRPLYCALYHERMLRNEIWGWFINKLYYEPLLRYRCDSVGKGLKTDGDIPLIEGSGKIIIGDNVRIGPQGAWFLTRNLYDSPLLVIGNNTSINYRTVISVEQRVEIGENCLIAEETKIFDNNSHGLSYENRDMSKDDVAPIIIEDHAWIGMNSIILKGVTIGKGAVVAAGSIVTKDVPPMTLVAGNPARIIRRIALVRQGGVNQNIRDQDARK